MQDFRHFDYTITPETLKELIKTGKEVIVIINGEYYDLRNDKEEEI